jgi:hypothetical protein
MGAGRLIHFCHAAFKRPCGVPLAVVSLATPVSHDVYRHRETLVKMREHVHDMRVGERLRVEVPCLQSAIRNLSDCPENAAVLTAADAHVTWAIVCEPLNTLDSLRFHPLETRHVASKITALVFGPQRQI